MHYTVQPKAEVSASVAQTRVFQLHVDQAAPADKCRGAGSVVTGNRERVSAPRAAAGGACPAVGSLNRAAELYNSPLPL